MSAEFVRVTQFVFSSAADGDSGGIAMGPEAAHMPQDAIGAVTSFIMAVAREGAIAAAHHLAEITLTLNHHVRFLSPEPGTIACDVTHDAGDLSRLSADLLRFDSRAWDGPRGGR